MRGIAIDCGKCAACCYETVPIITHHDIDRIATFTAKPPAQFIEMYSKRSVSVPTNDRGWVEMLEGRRIAGLRQRNGRCLFLAKDGHCAIYAARPIVCRTYPFVAQLDARGRIVAIGFKERASHGHVACTATAVLDEPGGTLAEDAQQGDREDKSYWRKIARWNRSATRRTLRAFLSFLGVQRLGQVGGT